MRPRRRQKHLDPGGRDLYLPASYLIESGCGRARGGWVTSRMQPEDNVSFEPVVGRAPLILGGHDFHSITEAVAAPVERTPSLGWWLALAVSLSMLGLL